MTWYEKLDKFWIGLLTGLVFPALIFFFYWLFFHRYLSFPHGFYRYLTGGYLLSNVIKLCGLSDLIVFYLGLRKKMDSFSKGVILSVLFYVGLVAYVSYYMEPAL